MAVPLTGYRARQTRESGSASAPSMGRAPTSSVCESALGHVKPFRTGTGSFWGAPKSLFVFFCKMVLVVLSVFNFIQKNFVDYIVTAVISVCIKKINIGEFLCSHFNTEDERRYAIFLAYYVLLFQEGKNTTEMQKKICAVCGEGAVTDQMCQKWFVKFPTGDFSLDDAPWSGRPIEVDSNQRH